MLNDLLHEIVSRVHHASEAERDALHALVDKAVPTPAADTPDADAPAGTDTPTKAK
ncbi:hypothetical protein [Streptomyces collinus]|uniref:hypothetical protein n=1 Tax=Streptomyces collinus TaxID=42684 RepID=UPI000423B6F8|nr:hypothetical protein [Streptomyces collinus]